MVSLRCMNCSADGADKQVLGVLVCTACEQATKAFLQQGESDLRKMQVLLQEATRLALVEGTFRYAGPGQGVGDVLRTIISLVDAAERRRQHRGLSTPVRT